jgi:hypothetical protein
MRTKPQGPRFRVRMQSSGRTARVSYYVYDLAGSGRVTQGPLSKEQAQATADNLNATLGAGTGGRATQQQIVEQRAHLARVGSVRRLNWPRRAPGGR